MKKMMIRSAVLLLALTMLFAMSACGEPKGAQVSIPEAASSTLEKPSARELRERVIGQWGRLGEVMHEFYTDNTCIVGGMFGDYSIDDNGSLVLVSVGGTTTEYIWNDTDSTNYWWLDGDVICVNGNQYERIIEEETGDA